MNTIGSLLQKARLQSGASLDAAAAETKIKKEFLKAIESESWSKLPDLPVVTGFVKNYSDYLRVDRAKATALLRRDYPPKKKDTSPKSHRKLNFRIGPRITFLTGIVSVSLLISGYLLFQYLSFTSPPALIIRAPVDGQVVFDSTLTVSGKTDSGATIRINNQPALVGDDGNFESTIDLKEGEQEIVIEAMSRSDRITQEVRRIIFNKNG